MDDDDLLADLIALGAVVDGDLVAVGDRWAIHATIAYGGEILVAEYESLELAHVALAGTPPNPTPSPTNPPHTTTKEIAAVSDTPTSHHHDHDQHQPPVMFVHGLWLHASSWTPWIERFAAAGYDATAPCWPGEAATVDAARADRDAQAGRGIDDVVEHHAALIAALDEPPILIGHSFGGTVVERLLTAGLGVAGIAIDAAPIKGVLPVPISSLRSAFPVLKNPANTHRTVELTAEQFHYGFGNAIPPEESRELWERWTIPAPGRPIFQSASANLTPHSQAKVDTHNDDRGPLLLIAGGQDHTVPKAVTTSTLKQYRHSDAVTELIEFPDRGHSLVVDHGWTEIADACLAWLARQDLRAARVPR